MKSLKSVLAFLSVALFCLANPAIAQTEDNSARVVVPDVPGGALVAGCYKADRNLYGPYRLTFCLQRKGLYTVRGDSLRCDGTLSWTTTGRDVKISLRRQSCNRGLAWAAGNIVCRPRNALDLLLDQLLNTKPKTGADARVVVPDNPKVQKLTCTYRPTVAGKKSASFFAIRQ